MNDNGERLLECCFTYNLVICGTLFVHPDICKLALCSNNGRDDNQIDHLVVVVVSSPHQSPIMTSRESLEVLAADNVFR